MKRILIIICLCFCDLCYSQNALRIFHTVENDIPCDTTNVDQMLRDILSTDSRLVFRIGGMEFSQEDNSILLRMHQYYEDYRFFDSDLLVHTKNGVIATINGTYYSSIENIGNVAQLTNAEIIQIAKSEVSESMLDYNFQYQIEKIITKNNFDDTDENLYYASLVSITDEENIETAVDIIIDEQSGNILGENSLIYYHNGTANTRYNGTRTIGATQLTPNYVLCDMTRGNGIFTQNLNHTNNTNNLTEITDADNIWTTNEFHNQSKDDGALDVHWAAMKTYDYFNTVFNRSSYDNAGGPINCYVHYWTNYENAFWSSTKNAFCFGDGNEDYDIMTSLDIVAHEFGHALCAYTAKLKYEGESGAINEGLSDIWAACVENYHTSDKQTWLIGEDIDIRTGHNALRNMSNPKVEGQPDTYGGTFWAETTDCTPTDSNDYCGVHTNSGILNYWFYLLCQGGSGTNDLNNAYTVTGIGLDNAAKIVYRAETNYLTATSNYADMRECTIKATKDLFPNTTYVNSVENAWYAVGVEKSAEYVQFNSNKEIPDTSSIKWLKIGAKSIQISLPTSHNLVLIHDLNGRTFFQQYIGKSAEIDISSFPQGAYIISTNKQSCKFLVR